MAFRFIERLSDFLQPLSAFFNGFPTFFNGFLIFLNGLPLQENLFTVASIQKITI
jgi:hypothetical protein